MHTRGVAGDFRGRKTLWIVLALVAVPCLVALLRYGYDRTAVGAFGLLILGTRGSGIRLTIAHRFKLVFLSGWLLLLGFDLLMWTLGDGPAREHPSRGIIIFMRAMIGGAFGTWAAAFATLLIAFFAKRKRAIAK